jgi:GTP-binding protein
MLIDEATITVKAGNGGNGRVSFKRNAQTAKGGPDGGNAGNGGSVFVVGINDFTTLTEFRYKKYVSAEDGVNGGKQNLYGRNGEDLIIQIPVGTQIINLETNESLEVTDTTTKILIAKGGKGGRGNNEFKSATNQTPYYAEKGEPGEQKRFFLELKLIADVGLIGLPNSGKSSLLDALTNAHPKIGAYAFTTLEPNLGVLSGLVIADIPGLIEGASQGKGLGDKFLKHVEKTRILIHCLDLQSGDLKKDYQTIRKELDVYGSDLSAKKELLVLTKTDMIDEKTLKKNIKTAEKLNADYVTVSIYDDVSLQVLKAKILELSQLNG